MAYSKSPITLMRRRQYVEPMFRGERVAWNAPFPLGADASGWAYKVRECLNVAKRNPKRFPDLAKLADSYKVEVLSEYEVRASIESNGEMASDPSMATGQVVTPASSTTTFPEARTRLEIAQTLLREGVGDGPFHYPNGSLTPVELTRLASWAATQNLFVLKPQGAGITLVKVDDSIPENARIVP